MARLEPPTALTKKQFEERCAFLRQKGLPETIDNIDPDLYNHVRKSRKALATILTEKEGVLNG